MNFDIDQYKIKSLKFISEVKEALKGDLESSSIYTIKNIWDSYLESEYLKLNLFFTNLIESNSNKYYRIVPLETFIANFDRLIDVLLLDGRNLTLNEMSIEIPERIYDLKQMLARYQQEIESFFL